jgi:hypothetical protein
MSVVCASKKTGALILAPDRGVRVADTTTAWMRIEGVL